jgi:hypothetical protein
MKKMLFHARRRAPNDGGILSRSATFTKRAAQQRRDLLVAFVMRSITPAELLEIMRSPRPPSIPELIEFAHQRAAENPCPHCGKPLTLESVKSGQVCTQFARAREENP